MFPVSSSSPTVGPPRARSEFERIIARRSVSPVDPLYPLAYLGAGRAARRQNDIEAARKYYGQLSVFWATADSTFGAVAEARREMAELR